jgi:hypothetical protein
MSDADRVALRALKMLAQIAKASPIADHGKGLALSGAEAVRPWFAPVPNKSLDAA